VPPIAEPTEASFDLAERIERMLGDGQPEVYSRIMAEVERELLTRALRRTRGHQAQASELLGINRTTLRTKLRELGIALDKVVSDRPSED
jgi:two-component system nitrogen regulation response regulator GlnG